ncbi:MAG: porin [Alphaproteobacteria bacterium]|nr:porin [Alphaproteobacteria bacterium]
MVRRWNRPVLVVGLWASGLVLHAAPSHGEENGPSLSAAIEIEMQLDRRSGRRGGDLTDTFTDTKLELELGVGGGFALKATLHAEPVRDPTASRAFQDHGLYAEQLFVEYEQGPATLFAGKYNPTFGTVWDINDSLYAKNFAEDYERNEAIGFGGRLKQSLEGLGAHEAGIQVFFFDSGPLSNSAFTRPAFGEPGRMARPGRVRRSDPFAGNTRSPNNVNLTLKGGEFEVLPDLAYHVGYIHLAGGEGQSRDENGVVLNLTYEIALSESLKLTPLVEYARFADFQGFAQDADYLTLGVTAAYDNWIGLASYTARRLDEAADGSGPNGRDSHERLISASLGYRFDFGLGVYAGWKHERLLDDSLSTAGVKLRYERNF